MTREEIEELQELLEVEYIKYDLSASLYNRLGDALDRLAELEGVCRKIIDEAPMACPVGSKDDPDSTEIWMSRREYEMAQILKGGLREQPDK